MHAVWRRGWRFASGGPAARLELFCLASLPTASAEVFDGDEEPEEPAPLEARNGDRAAGGAHVSDGPIRDDADLRAAHKASIHNRALVSGGGRCGCYHCLSVFEAAEVRDWVDDGRTAMCPRCGMDAVLPVGAAPIDTEFLRRMRTHWFERTVRLDPDAPWPPGEES